MAVADLSIIHFLKCIHFCIKSTIQLFYGEQNKIQLICLKS